MKFTTLFFDLDDTLYQNQSGLWAAIRERMSQYMSERLGLPGELVPGIRREYFQAYGTTLRGLQLHHSVDADEYLAYVHDLPLEDFIQPDPELAKMLSELPQRRFIFTNADANHARRVIDILGLDGCFDGIIDIRRIDFACKPEPAAYERALLIAGSPPPGECLMLDDSIRNLIPAHRMGITTVLVNPDGNFSPGADFRIAQISDLRRIFPDLWDGNAGEKPADRGAHGC